MTCEGRLGTEVGLGPRLSLSCAESHFLTGSVSAEGQDAVELCASTGEGWVSISLSGSHDLTDSLTLPWVLRLCHRATMPTQRMGTLILVPLVISIMPP